jgi:ABC-type Zn uptake system ZnuABC Zn-binding protein ZnuA
MLQAALPYRHLDRKDREGAEQRLTGIIDGRTFFRWLQTDPHFWNDPGNWKRFAKDNPEVTPWRT